MCNATNENPIACCPSCRTPLVWTFKFSKAEYYCSTCKSAMGMLEAERRAWSADLAKRHKQLVAVFGELSKPCIAYGERRMNCEKCSAGEDHLNHASAEAIAASRAAYDVLIGKVPA